MKKILIVASLVPILLTISFAVDKLNIEKIYKKKLKKGSVLPYEILKDGLINIKTGEKFQIRGGYGSDMVAHPSHLGQFYALTDRGPNARVKNTHKKGKKFLIPNYTPRIGLFELQNDGKIKMIRQILLKRPNGTVITGLPNPKFGSTSETPYDLNGKIITIDKSKPYDKKTNPIKFDNYGLNGEGLVALRDGTFWISDDYGPHIVHFSKNGRELERINPFKNDKRVKHNLPAEFANRRPNRGMEGLSITKDETRLIGIMQSTMCNPSKTVKNLNITRIVSINPKTGKVAQYLYKQEKAQNSNSGLAIVGKNKFYVIERDGKLLKGNNKNIQKHIYEIDLSTGTNLEEIKTKGRLRQDNKLGLLIDGKTLEEIVKLYGWEGLEKVGIKPVSKKLVVDMIKKFQYPHDKMEGMWIINNKYMGVLNDDDFAISSKKGKLIPKTLGTGKIDESTLYIIKRK